MKKFIVLVLFTSLLFMLSVQASTSQKSIDKTLDKNNEKVNAKCHLVLVNGNEGIFFWRLSRNRFSNMSNWVVGRSVLPEDSTKEVKVYKAHECVLEDMKFTSGKAKLLDKNVLR